MLLFLLTKHVAAAPLKVPLDRRLKCLAHLHWGHSPLSSHVTDPTYVTVGAAGCCVDCQWVVLDGCVTTTHFCEETSETQEIVDMSEQACAC